jgi:hypothetical protein
VAIGCDEWRVERLGESNEAGIRRRHSPAQLPDTLEQLRVRVPSNAEVAQSPHPLQTIVAVVPRFSTKRRITLVTSTSMRCGA